MSRAAGSPPDLTGFSYVAHLGSGGFADVYLYDQRRPARRVAVKVLVADHLDAAARRRFDTEADLMALLSNHPNILTIFQADVTADERPFLVMEYCPRPNLGVRYRRDPLSVTEALTTGIQLAGAVESVHRAGILHRDIKPANILVTEYNRPVLADFGISVASGDIGQAEGLSVPWAPPEAILDPTGTAATADVYSLAATLYSLLAGRHPFEVPGGDNSQHLLLDRITTAPLPRLGRPDVPAALDRVLATAMAKEPAARYPSALALGRALQQVQVELALPLTSLEIRQEDQEAGEDSEADEPGTRVRAITAVDPSPRLPEAWGTTRPARPAQQSPLPSVQPSAQPSTPTATPRVATIPATARSAPSSILAAEDTVHRSALPTGAGTGPDPVAGAIGPPVRSRRRTILVAAASGLVLLGAGVGVAVSLGGAPPPEASDTHTGAGTLPDPLAGVVAPVTDLAGTIEDGMVTFQWTHPDPVEGDTFLVRPGDAVADEGFTPVTEATISYPAGESGRECLEVIVRRSDGRASAAVEGCVSADEETA